LDVTDGVVFTEIDARVFEFAGNGGVHGVYFIDGADVLRPYLVDYIGTVRLIPVPPPLEKPDLPRLAKLHQSGSTSFRLLLRCQLSSPREESGRLGLLSFR
jgi:hypothetical protein